MTSHDINIVRGMNMFSALKRFFGDCSSGNNVHVLDIVYVFKNGSSDSRVVICQCHESLDVVFILKH